MCQYLRQRYRNFSQEEKQKRHQYGREQLKKFFKDETQRFQFLFSASGYSKKKNFFES